MAGGGDRAGVWANGGGAADLGGTAHFAAVARRAGRYGSARSGCGGGRLGTGGCRAGNMVSPRAWADTAVLVRRAGAGCASRAAGAPGMATAVGLVAGHRDQLRTGDGLRRSCHWQRDARSGHLGAGTGAAAGHVSASLDCRLGAAGRSRSGYLGAGRSARCSRGGDLARVWRAGAALQPAGHVGSVYQTRSRNPFVWLGLV